MSATLPLHLRRPLRWIDAKLWRLFFGRQDYMLLRPPWRLRMRIALRFPFVLGRPGSSRPIFVVGCPRSGTTITASILATSAELVWLGQESHWIWERFNPPSKRPEYSQVVRPGTVICSTASALGYEAKRTVISVCGTERRMMVVIRARSALLR